MKIENSKYLFLACAGLIASGNDGYDRGDAEVSALAGQIQRAGFPEEAKDWFSQARTGQVAVNPYWPRGSALAAACPFVGKDYQFDRDGFLSFWRGAGFSDSIGPDSFESWISDIGGCLRLLEDHPSVPALWSEYAHMVVMRSGHWSSAIGKTDEAAGAFFGEEAPELIFWPNLFFPCIADFVRMNGRIIVIASEPDAETMLHEALHTAVGRYRREIEDFAANHGVSAFADQEKMLELGYMTDRSAASAAHAVEETFVRALSTVLSGGGEDRLRSHASFGFEAAPEIGRQARQAKPDLRTLGEFVRRVLDERRFL